MDARRQDSAAPQQMMQLMWNAFQQQQQQHQGLIQLMGGRPNSVGGYAALENGAAGSTAGGVGGYAALENGASGVVTPDRGPAMCDRSPLQSRFVRNHSSVSIGSLVAATPTAARAVASEGEDMEGGASGGAGSGEAATAVASDYEEDVEAEAKAVASAMTAMKRPSGRDLQETSFLQAPCSSAPSRKGEAELHVRQVSQGQACFGLQQVPRLARRMRPVLERQVWWEARPWSILLRLAPGFAM
jgi:hypothetical protein